jgi:RHS repeat-associated protein
VGAAGGVSFNNETGSGRTWNYMYSYNQAGRVVNQHAVLHDQDFEASYTWDTEGRMTQINYPGGPSYQMQFDNMGRVGSMLDVSNGTYGAPTVASASYGAAGQITNLSYFGWSETRTFNSLLQMTQQTVSNGSSNVMDQQYLYTSGANNGRITSSVDGTIGETVNYSYDALNRLSLAQATSNAWGQSFSYDGFGNMTSKTPTVGSAPSWGASIDAATNRISGVSYDGNGNQTSNGEMYDVENRIIALGLGNGDSYSYDHAGKRVLKQYYPSTYELYFYGIGGQKLLTQTCQPGDGGDVCGTAYNVYFGGKLMKSKNVVVATDRLGSVRANGNGEQFRYYPYGEERTSTADGRDKFGTYMRDNPGQDYADQRYYYVGTGRFNVADPYKASGGPEDPGSWNRYAYVVGDPLNFNDPRGLALCDVKSYFQVNGSWFANVLCVSEYSSMEQGTVTLGIAGSPLQADPTVLNPTLAKRANDLIGKDLDNAELWDFLYDAYVQAQNLLKDNKPCIQLFGTDETRNNGWDPAVVLGKLFWRQGNLGSIDYGNTLGGLALTYPTLSGLAIAATVNVSNEVDWGMLDHRERGLILLHELGHAYNLLSVRGSGGSAILQADVIPSRQDFNQNLVWTTCGTKPNP